jgi:hypothetical protein
LPLYLLWNQAGATVLNLATVAGVEIVYGAYVEKHYELQWN